jgi:hypothetical protein
MQKPIDLRERGVTGRKWGLEPLFYTIAKGSFTTSVSTCVLALVVKEPYAKV